MEWILAHWRPGQPDAAPRRVLVAGCGTGAEAFAFSRRFPHAEIVGADFSRRAIDMARQYQKRATYRRSVRFVVADFSAPGFERLTGVDFDLASCHGALSYVPRRARAFENLSRCLASDGALVLGVNGARHLSAGLRAGLPEFRLGVARFPDEPHVRQVLALFDALLGHRRGTARIARRSAEYLASDVFGELIQNLPLSAWARSARAAGLHLQNTLAAHRALRLAVEQGLCELLLPRSRARVCGLIDALEPAPFHMLLFTRQPVVVPPWRTPHVLQDWRPLLTGLFPLKRLPSAAEPDGAIVTLDSSPINTRIQWPMTGWQRALLREADGRRSVRTILGSAGAQIPPADVASFLYVLYMLLVIDMRAPRARVR